MAWVDQVRALARQHQGQHAQQRREAAPAVARWLLDAAEAGKLVPGVYGAPSGLPGGWEQEYPGPVLRALFVAWCRERHVTPDSPGAFGKRLGRIGFAHRPSHGMTFWRIPDAATVVRKAEAYAGISMAGARRGR